MEVLRLNKIPAIYAEIPWIRKTNSKLIADLSKDKKAIKRMQAFCEGSTCISEEDGDMEFNIKGVFPDNWNTLSGKTGEVIFFYFYKWRLWDILTFINNEDKPSNLIPLPDAGITKEYLNTIIEPVSCIPLIKKLKNRLDFGEFTNTQIKKIEDYEKELFNAYNVK